MIRINAMLDIAQEQLASSLNSHFKKKEKDIKLALKTAFENFDLQKCVDEQIHRHIHGAIEQAIKQFFLYGEGQKIITIAVSEGMQHYWSSYYTNREIKALQCQIDEIRRSSQDGEVTE